MNKDDISITIYMSIDKITIQFVKRIVTSLSRYLYIKQVA